MEGGLLGIRCFSAVSYRTRQVGNPGLLSAASTCVVQLHSTQSGNSPFRCGAPSRREKKTKKIALTTREKPKHPRSAKTTPEKVQNTPQKPSSNKVKLHR